MVSAPYEIHGQVVGTLGVIGPTRMAYDRMIEIVDITSRLVSNALVRSRCSPPSAEGGVRWPRALSCGT